MSPKEALESARDGAFLLDVREPVEWSQARIDGATLIPLRDVPRRLDEIPRDGEIICYCATGIRSAHAVSILRDAGFANVSNLAGGIKRWAGEGLPIVHD